MAAGSLENLDVNEAQSLLNRYLDGDMDASEEAVMARRLEEDSELREELEGLTNVVGALGKLPLEFAPDDFVDGVQARMRKQSAGRLFAQNFLTQARVPYEAVAVVMIIVMAAAYLLLEPPIEAEVRDVEQSTAVIGE
ncbi:MAG: anti-sigma factor family protein [Bradymonadaceae bacterium]